MIRAHRVSATAQDDASLVSGWNISPNVTYILRLLPGESSCGVLLFDEDNALVASGAALVGTEQPCVLTSQTGQAVEMVDAELGWHLLLTTIGTESQREIRINPAVDLPDEIHPAYADDDMALARATAAIDEAAHYRDDVTVSCPLGLGAGLGDVVSVPVDGVAVVGQVESITWTATPDGVTEQGVIRRSVAIAPAAYVEPIPVDPPSATDDTSTTDANSVISGNVLGNDETGLQVVAINGFSGGVGVAVDGDNGGFFTVSSDGAWTFDPDGDFALLSGTETANTSVVYHVSNGTAEASAVLTITVTRVNAVPVVTDDAGETAANVTTTGNVLSNDTDADLDSLNVSRVSGSAANVGVATVGSSGGLFTINSDGTWLFDPNGDFDDLVEDQSAETSVSYHAFDGLAETEGTLTITVTAAVISGGIEVVGTETSGYVAAAQTYNVAVPAGVSAGDLILVCASLVSAAGTNETVQVASSGYSKIVANVVGGGTPRAILTVEYKVSDGTETSVDVIAGATSYYKSAATVYVLRGVDTDHPLDILRTIAYTYGLTPEAIQITPGAMAITVGACSSTSSAPSAPTAPSGVANVVSQTGFGASNTGLGLFSGAQMLGEDPGDAGRYQWSDYGTIASWVGVTLLLRPANVVREGVYLIGHAQYFMPTGTPVASYTIQLPEDTQEGDLVVVLNGQVYTSDRSPGVLTAGYTEIAELYANDSVDANVSVSYKVMGATPDTEVEVVGSTASPYPGGTVVQVFRGVDQTTPMDVSPTTATGINGGIPTAPAITPATLGAKVVSLFGTAVWYQDTVLNPASPPSGFKQTSTGITGSTYKFQAGMASAQWDGVGAVNPGAWSNVSTSANDSWGAVSIALRPAT